MIDISGFLHRIKNAVYGVDVRDSIHDAIKECGDLVNQCYKDATGHPESVAAVVRDINVERSRIDSLLNPGAGDSEYTKYTIPWNNSVCGFPINAYVYTNGINAVLAIAIQLSLNNVTINNHDEPALWYQLPEELLPVNRVTHLIGQPNLYITIFEDGKINLTGNGSYDALPTSSEIADDWSGQFRVLYLPYTLKTPSIPELNDIRVGADGTIYPTAGEAIRTQFGNIGVKDNEVTAEKISGTTYEYSGGLNQVDYTKSVKGYWLGANGDGIDEKEDWSISDKMPINDYKYYRAKLSTWCNGWLTFFDANDNVLTSAKYGMTTTTVYGEIPEGAEYAICSFPTNDLTAFVVFAEVEVSSDNDKTDLTYRHVSDGWGKLEINGLQQYFKDGSIALSKLTGSGAKMYNMFSNEVNKDAGVIVLPTCKTYYVYNMSEENINNATYYIRALTKTRHTKLIGSIFINCGTYTTCSISPDIFDDVLVVYFENASLTDNQINGLMISERNDLTEYHPYGELYYEPNEDMKKLVLAAKEDIIKQYDGGVLLGIGDSYMQNNALLADIATRHGLVCDNRGMASSSISGDEAQTVGLYPFWSRIDAAVDQYTAGHTIGDNTYNCDDVKLIVFMGGANDGWIESRRGTGKTDSNTNTIYGALNKCFSTLLSSFPNADIIVILQPVNYNYSSSGWTEDQAKGYGFASLADAKKFSDYQLGQYAMHIKESIVKEMAEMYGLNIVDCCFNWFSVLNPNDRATYWSTDKLHLLSAGNEQLYNVALENKINNLKVTRN